MSSRASLSSSSWSSSSTDLPEATTRERLRTGSQCSVTSSIASADKDDAPTPETVSAKLDDYVSASKKGRAAYVRGDMGAAVTQFNQALNLELETELECLYDTSIGFVSGLVKQEVNSRLQSSPKHQAVNCAKILSQLSVIYDKANTKSLKKPTEPKWYLRMGAALCLINEWEKAKLVYKEGINMCKDKKELKQALKKLTQIEQITSNAEIPEEDIDDRVIPSSPSRRSQMSAQSQQSPSSERKAKPSNVHRRRAKSTVAPARRSGSVDTGVVLGQHEKLIRTSSMTGSSSAGRLADLETRNVETRKASDSSIDIEFRNSSQSPPVIIEPRSKKRFSFNIFGSSPKHSQLMGESLNTKRFSLGQNLFSTIGRSHRPIPTLSPDDREAWGECFSPAECSVIDYRSFCPSAVVHMRELSVNDPLYTGAGGSDSLSSGTGGDEDSLEERDYQVKRTYNAVKFKSMKIDDDDSELDDED